MVLVTLQNISSRISCLVASGPMMSAAGTVPISICKFAPAYCRCWTHYDCPGHSRALRESMHASAVCLTETFLIFNLSSAAAVRS